MIPRHFHQYWSETELPVEYQRYQASWTALNPGWDLTLWTPDTLPPLRNQRRFDNPESWSAPGWFGQFRSNIARAEILRDFGGVWIDSDMECLRPIEILVAGHSAFIARDNERQVQTAIMGGVPRHPFFDHILELTTAAPRTKTWKLMSVITANQAIALHPDVKVLEPWTFYPIDRVTGEGAVGHAYGLHHPRAAAVSDLQPAALQALYERGWDGK